MKTFKKVAIGAMLFPWSLLPVAYVAIDKLAHVFGACIGG